VPVRRGLLAVWGWPGGLRGLLGHSAEGRGYACGMARMRRELQVPLTAPTTLYFAVKV